MTSSPLSDDDARLARAIAAGDESALGRAYDSHGSLVFGLALRMMRSTPDAEEVLQDVFTTLWRTAARFDEGRGSLAAYLTTLTRHRAIDRFRARRSRPDVALGGDGAAPRAGAEPSPADGAALGDAGRVARRALDDLSADEKRVVEMAYFDGLTQSEIAARTGMPLGTVKGRTRAALRRLRELLPPSLGGAS